MMRSDDGSTSSDAKIVDYAERGNSAMVASETPEAIEAMWLPRGEATMMWGSKFFDRDLKPLDRASDDVALEVRLIREPREDSSRSRFA